MLEIEEFKVSFTSSTVLTVHAPKGTSLEKLMEVAQEIAEELPTESFCGFTVNAFEADVWKGKSQPTKKPQQALSDDGLTLVSPCDAKWIQVDGYQSPE